MERTKWIDQAKGLGIVFVVLGHACVPSLVAISGFTEKLYLFIYLFHMPVFMYLSGYAFFHFSRKHSLPAFVQRKVVTLLKPYFFYIVAMYLFFWSIHTFSAFRFAFAENTQFSMKNILKDIILCDGTVDKHLWYIYLLFFISIASYIIDKSVVIKWILVALCAIIGPSLFSKNLPTICNLPYYLPFFFLGKLDLYDLIKKISRKFRFVFFIAYIVGGIIYACNIQNLKKLGLGLAYIKYIAGYIGIVFFFVILSFIEKKEISKWFCYLGEKSFVIYLLHQPIIVSGTALLSYKLMHSPIVSIIISTFVGVVTPVLLEKMYRKVGSYVGGENS